MNEITEKLFKVEKIIYYNSTNCWGVLGTVPLEFLGEIEYELSNDFGNIAISGNFHGIYEGCEIKVSGDVIKNNKYGKQIQIKSLTVIEDNKSKEGVINFLARSLIKGISIQNAKKIYEKYKDKAIDVVLNSPDKLLSISGIGLKTVDKVKKSVQLYKSIKPLIEYCTKIGLSYGLIIKLHSELGQEALNIIKEDPYKILEVSQLIGFKQIDDIYIKSGGDPLGRKRLEVGLLYTLKRMAQFEGSTGCKSSALKTQFYKLLEISDVTDSYEKILAKLEQENKVKTEKNQEYECDIVYYKNYLDTEKFIAENLLALKTYGIRENKISQEIIDEEINNFPFTLNKQQISAINKCLNEPIAVLTGSGGSGKSSITKALHNIYYRSGYDVALLAPTAKACRRLEECTGSTAKTLHSFLEIRSSQELINNKPSTVKYENKVLIIDEASMLDILIFKYLLKRITPTTKILLVGDNNQLPSVQAGNILGDLILSCKIPVAFLTDIVRQEHTSHIIKYCNMINKGELFEPCEYDDFHYEEFGDSTELRDVLISKYLEETEKNGLSEVQVITPYKKGELGMDNLNRVLQTSYNSNGQELISPFKLGDRVRHTQNNYNKNVFNGDVGIIIDYVDDEVVVDYGNKVIYYNSTELEDLTLSYCSTVHSSQGSEYKTCFVILDDTSANDFLLIRRLLYTAVSRGRNKVYILTKPYLVDKCISNNTYKPRITMLKRFLKEVEVLGFDMLL